MAVASFYLPVSLATGCRLVRHSCRPYSSVVCTRPSLSSLSSTSSSLSSSILVRRPHRPRPSSSAAPVVRRHPSSVVVIRRHPCRRRPCRRSSSVAVGLLSSGLPRSCSARSRSCWPCWRSARPRSFVSTLVCALSTCTVTINNIIHYLLTFLVFHLHSGLTTPEKTIQWSVL